MADELSRFRSTLRKLISAAGGMRPLARLADGGSMSDATIRGWLKNPKLPSGTSLKRLADGLGMDFGQVLGSVDLPPDYKERIRARLGGEIHEKKAETQHPLTEEIVREIIRSEIPNIVAALKHALQEEELEISSSRNRLAQ